MHTVAPPDQVLFVCIGSELLTVIELGLDFPSDLDREDSILWEVPDVYTGAEARSHHKTFNKPP